MSQPLLKEIAPTSRPELDKLVERLKKNADAYARSPIGDRIDLARGMIAGFVAVAEDAVRAACAAKGVDFDSPMSAEDWLAGSVVTIRTLRLTVDALERIARGESPIPAKRVRTRPDGRVVVDVFPTGIFDQLLVTGFRGEVWMEAGLSSADVIARAGSHYHVDPSKRQGKLSLVLGAGNVASIAALDVAYKLFVEGKVCLLKMNPVNAYLGPFIESAMSAAVERGLVAVCYGGGDVGAYLCEHPLVDEIHITGSDKTHDAIIWGPPGKERDARKAKREPLNQKEITSELGNVSPVIVVPGPYSDSEFAFQAASIASAVTNNGSFNCNATKMLVQSKNWPGRQRLLDGIRASLTKSPLRMAYYPGAEGRWKDLVESHPDAVRLGDAKPGELPWALITGLDAKDKDERCFFTEPFCSLLSEAVLEPSDPVDFLDAAVDFANDRLWGTLNASIIVHPESLQSPRVAQALDRAIAKLRYGAVAINHWPAVVYALGSLPWGGHPSATLENIQSGRGWVHNTYLLEGIEKSVLFGPLVLRPKPPWFQSHSQAHILGRKLAAFEAAPSLRQVPSIVWSAIRG